MLPYIFFAAIAAAFVSASVVKRAPNSVRPAIGTDFPDPSIINVNNAWYAFATQGNGVHIQMAITQNFDGDWNIFNSYDALPHLPSWVKRDQPDVWAPDVVQISSDRFVLYYAARLSSNPSLHCIGSATSPSIAGPYAASEQILACHENQGGAIDPSGFYDPRTNRRFITYKIDGNALGHGGNCNNGIPPIVPTPIMLLEVSGDGTSPISGPMEILNRSDGDGPLIEAPSLTMLNGKYYLFFSSNCYDGDLYDISFATSDSVYGPFQKGGPLLVTPDLGFSAPGGAQVTADGGFMAFHAGRVGQRFMYTARVQQQGGTQIQICTNSGCKSAS